MPSKWFIAAIVLFWVAALAWLFFREILPELQTDEPDLFPVQAADEYRSRQGLEALRFWSVSRNGVGNYRLRTSLIYHEDEDLYEFAGLLTAPEAQQPDKALPLTTIGAIVHRPRIVNRYWVRRSGELVTLDMDSIYRFSPADSEESQIEIEMKLQGKPRSGNFAPTVSVTEVGFEEFKAEMELEPAPVSGLACVLNPLNPPNKVLDLRPGQRWKCAVVDPFSILQLPLLVPDNSKMKPALQAIASYGPLLPIVQPLQVLPIRVEDNEDRIQWPRQEGSALGEKPRATCRTILCGEENSPVWFRIWVHEKDERAEVSGLVIRQETHLWGETWIFTRITEH